MKEKVLSNIINYVTTNDITIPILESVSSDNNNTSDLQFNSMNKILIWEDLKFKFKFDAVSMYLLRNFRDAILAENYIGAAYMKKEILNHWELMEDDFWRIGRDLLVDLKNGVMNSELLKDQEGFIGDLLYTWTNEGYSEYSYVMNGIIEFQEYITHYYPKQDLSTELFDSIMKSDIEHPLIIIDKIVDYFKLIKTN